MIAILLILSYFAAIILVGMIMVIAACFLLL